MDWSFVLVGTCVADKILKFLIGQNILKMIQNPSKIDPIIVEKTMISHATGSHFIKTLSKKNPPIQQGAHFIKKPLKKTMISFPMGTQFSKIPLNNIDFLPNGDPFQQNTVGKTMVSYPTGSPFHQNTVQKTMISLPPRPHFIKYR